MTRTTLVANVILCALLAVGFASCSDDEQATLQAQQVANSRREAEEHAESARKAAEDTAAAPQPVETASPEPEQTPEAPAEPEKVDNYKLSVSVVCRCHEQKECGTGFWGCSDDVIRECMHNAEYRVLSVDKTDDNSGICN